MKDFIERSFNYIKPGDKYGKLTILNTGQIFNTYRYYALCKCECGKEKFIRIDSIRSGHTISCGCEQLISATKHGCWHSPIFNNWRNMMDRCFNPLNKRFHDYGGRGITVCERWQNIINFIKDMEPTYKEGLTIDRINNDGNYEPSNCRWATRKQQNRNCRRNINFTHNGETHCLQEWSEILNIPYVLLWDRIFRGWTFEKSISTPKITTFLPK
jgi:hypothetical protein